MKLPSFQTDAEYTAYDKGFSKGITTHRRLMVQLFDALEQYISELYADGPTRKGEERAQRALANFEKRVGERHDGKWRER